jgi:hypothetical protein
MRASASFPSHPAQLTAARLASHVPMRIPMKPAGDSDLKAATHSDFKAATIPI